MSSLRPPSTAANAGTAAAIAPPAQTRNFRIDVLRGIHDNEVFGFAAIAAGTAVLLIGVHNERVPGWALRSRALAGLRWLGRHSYELYLFHIIVLGLMRSFVPRATMPEGHSHLDTLLVIS